MLQHEPFAKRLRGQNGYLLQRVVFLQLESSDYICRNILRTRPWREHCKGHLTSYDITDVNDVRYQCDVFCQCINVNFIFSSVDCVLIGKLDVFDLLWFALTSKYIFGREMIEWEVIKLRYRFTTVGCVPILLDFHVAVQFSPFSTFQHFYTSYFRTSCPWRDVPRGRNGLLSWASWISNYLRTHDFVWNISRKSTSNMKLFEIIWSGTWCQFQPSTQTMSTICQFRLPLCRCRKRQEMVHGKGYFKKTRCMILSRETK